MFNHSPEIALVAKALVSFQREVEGVTKNAVNDSIGNFYSDLAGVWAAIREPLTRLGLSVIQLPGTVTGTRIALETIILHESGQFISLDGTLPFELQNPTIHSAASAISYLRRYSLMGALGLPSLDDDGNAGAGKKPREPRQQREKAPEPKADPTRAGFDTAVVEANKTMGAFMHKDLPGDEIPMGDGPDTTCEEECEKRLIPAVRNTIWARTWIPAGKNYGKLLGELDDDAISWYSENAAGSRSLATQQFLSSLSLWREHKKALSTLAEEGSAKRAKEAEDAKAARVAAGEPEKPKRSRNAGPKPTQQQEAQQEATKARSDLPKRPAKPSEPEKGPDTPPVTGKRAGGDAEPNKNEGWRNFILPIGKESKGKQLGELPLAELKSIKTFYLDKREWGSPEKLKDFDLGLKAAVEAGIANEGRPPEKEKPAMKSGPVADLFQRLESFVIDPDEFLAKMKHLEHLPAELETLSDIDPSAAGGFLADWDATMKEFDRDLM